MFNMTIYVTENKEKHNRFLSTSVTQFVQAALFETVTCMHYSLAACVTKWQKHSKGSCLVRLNSGEMSFSFTLIYKCSSTPTLSRNIWSNLARKGTKKCSAHKNVITDTKWKQHLFIKVHREAEEKARDPTVIHFY